MSYTLVEVLQLGGHPTTWWTSYNLVEVPQPDGCPTTWWTSYNLVEVPQPGGSSTTWWKSHVQMAGGCTSSSKGPFRPKALCDSALRF